MTSSTDRIERNILINAPRARVWDALTNAEKFGEWFGAKLKGQAFVPGKQTLGAITICNFEHVMFDAIVERIEPQSLFSYRWHPFAVDKDRDYSQETRTLVEFTLSDAEGGTLLNVVESGFDSLPADRRADAFRANGGGWEAQLRNITQYAEN
ncbi:MAG: SRPBCC family protein [Pseudomonadota bacterium]